MSTEHPSPGSSEETSATPVVPEAGPGSSRPAYGLGSPTYGSLDPSLGPAQPPWGATSSSYGEPYAAPYSTPYGAPTGSRTGAPTGASYTVGGHPSRVDDTRSAARGFLGKLFDLSFTSFVTPSIVKVVYVLAIGVIGVSWLVYSLAAFARDPGLGLLVFLVVGPLVALVYLVVVRITLELYLAVIRLAEDVRELKDRAASTD